MMLKPALRPPLRAPMRGATTLKEGGGVSLRQIGTKCYLPNSLLGTYRYLMARSPHFNPAAATLLRVVLPNWYVTQGSAGKETGTGGAVTFTASIEYPAGVFTQITFGGSVTSPAVADLSQVVSDPVAVAIPANTLYWVRVFAIFTAGLPFSTSPIANYDNTNGQRTNVSIGAISDQTLGGTVSNTSADLTWTPVAILGMTSAKAAFIISDSRSFGVGDTAPVNASKFRGEIEPSLAPSIGVINGGVAGTRATTWAGNNNPNQLALIGYCTSVIGELGINDLNGGRTGAQAIADHQTIAGLVGKPYFLTTAPPITTGAWTLADRSDQTTSFAAQIAAYNTAVRALPAGVSGYFEVANQVSVGDKWLADGTVGKYTADGIHETSFANEAIRLSGAISATSLR